MKIEFTAEITAASIYFHILSEQLNIIQINLKIKGCFQSIGFSKIAYIMTKKQPIYMAYRQTQKTEKNFEKNA